MKKIPYETAIEKLTDIAKNALFYYNDYAYKFELVKLSPDEVVDLIINQKASTKNVLGVVADQKKWFSMRHDFKHWIEQQDYIFRWTAVNNKMSILCLDVPDRSDKFYEDVIVDRYLLINWDNEFIGLKTKVNYTPQC